MLNKIKNCKHKMFYISIIIGILICLPAFIPSFNVDFYCTQSSGYLSSAKTFMKSGRLFTALAYSIANLINIKFSIFSILSIILSILFLSISINIVYNFLIKYIKNKNLLSKILLGGGVILIYFNPLQLELLLFEEGFIMNLGILLVTIAAIKFAKFNKKDYFISFVYLLLGTICYQGIACYFIPLCFLFTILKLSEDNIKFKDVFIKTILLFIIYGVSLIISYVIVKLVNSFIFTDGSSKVGYIDIIYNIKKFIELLLFSCKNLFGFIDKRVFYGTIIILMLILVINTIFNKEKTKTFGFYFLIIIAFCFTAPFIPNLGMNSALNYTAARMLSTIGATLGFIIVSSIVLFDIEKNKYLNIIFVIVSLIYFAYNSYNYFNTLNVGLKRYKEDMKVVKVLHKKIYDYEKKTGEKVKTIYYAMDSNVAGYYYQYGITNSYNYRLYNNIWGMACAINIGDFDYKFTEMKIKDKDKYFKDKEYDEFDEEQLVFVKDKLYLLLY